MIGMMLVRNESGRWLEKVLGQMKQVCRKIIIIDDHSTDNTIPICKKYTYYVHDSTRSFWGSDELFQRKRLWDLATKNAHNGEWILCLDADETFAPGQAEKLIEYTKKADKYSCDGLMFSLYDMWNETEYREDKLWKAHLRHWVFCVKYDANKEYKWHETALHSGRFPKNAASKFIDGLPPLHIQHWGWSRAEDRQAKYDRYMQADPDGKYGILEQYQSILDENPNLVRYDKKKRVLIGAPVRQDADIFQEYIKSLDGLNTADLEVDRLFIFHNSPELIQYINGKDMYIDYQPEENEDYIKDENTHNWTDGNLMEVTVMKNNLLGFTLEHSYDYFLLVDSDLILHPDTLKQLLNTQKDLVAEIFWTKFFANKSEAPNAWDFDQYSFAESPERWRKPGLYPVGMSGACILISKQAILAGCNYNPIYNSSLKGEDRTFCTRAAALGLQLWLDTHYPCKHLYRRTEYEKYKEGGGYDGFKASFTTCTGSSDGQRNERVSQG